MRRTAPPDVAELRRLAEAATPGPWAWEPTGDKDNSWGLGVVVDDDGELVAGCVEPGTGEVIDPVCESIDGRLADAAYIAALSPDVVLALLDRIDQLEAAVRPADGRCGDCRRGHYSIPGGGITNYPCTTEGCTCWICHDGDGQPLPGPAAPAGEQPGSAPAAPIHDDARCRTWHGPAGSHPDVDPHPEPCPCVCHSAGSAPADTQEAHDGG